MTLFENVDIAELEKEMDDIKNWNKTIYKTTKEGNRVQTVNLGEATWRIIYKDGKIVDGSKGYKDLVRKEVESISAIDVSGKVLHTVSVVDDKFIIRIISLSCHLMKAGKVDMELSKKLSQHGFTNPKRCILLATKGEHVYVWDDGDIDQLHKWGNYTPYTYAKVGVLVKGEEAFDN